MPSVPRSFRSAASFRTWLERHHATATELVVRLFKVHAASRGMTYAGALDEALSFGWIDGVRRAHDADSFTIRFTPRKARSYWSDVNVRHARRLIAAGKMEPPGMAVFEKHDPSRSPRYSFESRPAAFDRELGGRFRADRKAWTFFQGQPPWYRRVSTFWVMSAKRAETRERRLDELMRQSRAGLSIKVLARNPKAGR